MKTRWLLIMIGVTAVVMYFFNCMTPLTLMDDVVYRCVWVEDETDLTLARRPVSSLADIVESQRVHYFVTNGRIIVHAVAQAVLAFVGEDVSDVVNTLFFCLLVLLCGRFAVMASKDCSTPPRPSPCESDYGVAVFLFIFLFYIFMPGFRDVFLWTLGCVNYLWTALVVLLFLTYFYRVERRPLSVVSFAVCPLALLAGWTHEALTLPLAFGLMVWMVMERRRVVASAALPAVVCFIAGSMLCAFSPATISRADTGGMPLLQRVVIGGMNLVYSMRITWLLLVVAAVAWYRRRYILLEELRRHYVIYCALLPAVGLVFVCGQTAARVCFHADFLASLVLVSLVLRLAPWRIPESGRLALLSAQWRGRTLMVGAVAVMAAVTIAVAGFALSNGRNYDFQMAQQRDASVGVVKIRQVGKTGSALFDALVDRYVLPSVIFGFNTCYQGFDADDVNLRSAAVLYGKPRVIYLPEDVVTKIETDTAAYTRLGTDSRGELAVMRVPKGRKVSSLRFILREERPETIPFYKRFLIHKNNVYDMPEQKFKTVDICGRTYLIFAVPLSNITRRIKYIEVYQSKSAEVFQSKSAE